MKWDEEVEEDSCGFDFGSENGRKCLVGIDEIRDGSGDILGIEQASIGFAPLVGLSFSKCLNGWWGRIGAKIFGGEILSAMGPGRSTFRFQSLQSP